MKGALSFTAALAALACGGFARAHHSISMFDLDKPVWTKGTVVRFDAVNPHVVFALDLTSEDGKGQRWTVEGPGLNSFNRMGLGSDFLQPGDVIEVCGFVVKDEVRAQLAARNTGALSRPNMHGHVLIFADGRMRAFGGYGKIGNCMRPDDQAERWVSFLSTDSRAANFWCGRRASPNFSSVAPQALVDEINRLLPSLC